jgi:hypothetical protein
MDEPQIPRFYLVRYQTRPDGAQRNRTFDTPEEAEEFAVKAWSYSIEHWRATQTTRSENWES